MTGKTSKQKSFGWDIPNISTYSNLILSNIFLTISAETISLLSFNFLSRAVFTAPP
ncbi:177L [Invertebrate iridescent virus 6]|uniref:177L n=1 Tax=Invertebrate iridescent virus 6 TaxID=176652 RepID=Q91FY7_IIV6|nr:177L [Invertebrate iridescent virus 6]AAK82045.1 177L [Invertebrate iridescent virus 6]QMS79590.1 hypothetical protein IIV6-T1_177 [Invertebrate iridescent virus 6]